MIGHAGRIGGCRDFSATGAGDATGGCSRTGRAANDRVFASVKHLTRAPHLLRYCIAQLQQRAVQGPGDMMTGMVTDMTSRRMIVWWFKVVVSGRFLDRFLCLPR
jgi:hypothetical protein